MRFAKGGRKQVGRQILGAFIQEGLNGSNMAVVMMRILSGADELLFVLVAWEIRRKSPSVLIDPSSHVESASGR